MHEEEGTMHAGLPQDLHEKLRSAIGRWARARAQLAHVKAQYAPGTGGGQLGASPEAAALFEGLHKQEAACARLWREVATIDDALASAREVARTAAVRARDRARQSGEANVDVAPPAEDAPVNILLVDDETPNLAALEAALDDPGYRFMRAASGEEALLALITEDFACLLLDVRMPGLSGFELAQTFNERRATARLPIIFLTAHYQDDRDALEGYASGAVDYVHKPFHPAVLRRKVEVFADMHRRRRQLQLRACQREQLARVEMAIAAASEAGQRARFLAEVGRALSFDLGYEDAIAAMLRVCIPTLGDAVVLTVADPDGTVHRFRGDTAQAKRGKHAFPAALSAETEQALRTGEPRLWRSGERAAAVHPLQAGAGLRSALAIVGAAQAFDAARLELVREFAGRAGMFLENARLRQSVREADRRAERFLAMLAHELRNPLAPISSAVHILRRAATPSAKDWARDVIGRQAGHMARLIEDLLDVARLVHGKVVLRKQAVALADIVHGAVESSLPRLQQRAQELAVDVPAKAVVVEGDPVRLVQAVTNLLDNASKFSAPGTTIALGAAFSGGEVRISVRDGGKGIAPEFLPHVFDLFSQEEQSLDRPQGGLGVGLTLARQVATLHGGRVAVHSAGGGKGTEAVICLPGRTARVAAGVAGRAGTSARPPHPIVATPVRVLVVDDDVASAETMRTLLEFEGFEVRAAPDGPAALQAAGEFLPDVVLLDIGLPGMNGIELAQRLRAQGRARNAMLIALTGYGDADIRQLTALAGFDWHLTKPANVNQLLEVLARVRGAGTASRS